MPTEVNNKCHVTDIRMRFVVADVDVNGIWTHLECPGTKSHRVLTSRRIRLHRKNYIITHIDSTWEQSGITSPTFHPSPR